MCKHLHLYSLQAVTSYIFTVELMHVIHMHIHAITLLWKKKGRYPSNHHLRVFIKTWILIGGKKPVRISWSKDHFWESLDQAWKQLKPGRRGELEQPLSRGTSAPQWRSSRRTWCSQKRNSIPWFMSVICREVLRKLMMRYDWVGAGASYHALSGWWACW